MSGSRTAASPRSARTFRAARRSTPLAATSCPAASTPYPSRNALHGHLFDRRFRERHARRALGGTTMVVDFCLPNPQQSLLEALSMWDNKTGKASCDYSFHVDHLVGRRGVARDGRGGRPRHHQLQALHGLQGRADGGRRRDVLVLPALRRSRRAAAGPCRERRRRRADDGKTFAEGNSGPEAHAYRARPRSRARRPTAPS